MNFPNHIRWKGRVSLGREWGNRSVSAHKVIRDRKGVDEDTLRERSRQDFRGKIVREGVTYRSTGMTHWHVRRSIHGDVDQFDFVANDRVKLTAGPRRFPREFRPKRVG